jgi:hypothetical protein
VVDSKDQCYGRPARYRITKPEYILFADEAGSNTNQKDDGLIGGQQIVTATNQTEGGCIGSRTDIHFTVLCFTAGNGEHVLCGIILKSEKSVSAIPISWQMGIDITKDPLTGVSQSETFRLNSGSNRSVQGGPVCNFQGKYLPCFVATSPKASITPEILADMLGAMDSVGLYDPTNGCMPFLLLDGHGSQMKLPFLSYITSSYSRWMVCCGVFYGSHLWQVADSSELNGCFKM